MPIPPHIAKRYPADWNLRRRFIVEYRAAGRCEWCGAVNYQPHPDTGSKGLCSTSPRSASDATTGGTLGTGSTTACASASDV